MHSSTMQASNILSGASPGYCWEQIPAHSLHLDRCVSYLQAPNCRLSSLEISAVIRANVLSSIIGNKTRPEDINKRDAFGNSVLHTATVLFAKPTDIRSLINIGANVNSLNNAGQTFLHLVAGKSLVSGDEICSLIEIAKENGFDFDQRDYLGQSVLHLLTRPCIPQHILGMIVGTLYDLRVDPKASRDYSGWTVTEQLNHFGTEAPEFSVNCEAAVLDLTGEKAGQIANQMKLKRHRERIKSTKCVDLYAHNFEKPTFIESLADLEQYTYHADLLRTIIKAISLPWFEDSNGRNGLHCLAEVSLKLPGHIWSANESDSAPRERYLIDLLQAGVDTNNYDKQGSTPLMAFIANSRADEDDELTTRILQRLLKAGANPNWRNRQGETALHIAVKLGRRTATKVLLQHRANVHARTCGGKGVLALGQEYCKKARENETLYAQIMLCLSLAIDAGAVSAPTVLQEWGFS